MKYPTIICIIILVALIWLSYYVEFYQDNEIPVNNPVENQVKYQVDTVYQGYKVY